MLKLYSRLILLQLIFVAIAVMTITAIRFLDSDTYMQMMTEYKDYAYFYTDISYVYDGE